MSSSRSLRIVTLAILFLALPGCKEDPVTISPSGTNVIFTPADAQVVARNTAAQFTLTTSTGYTVSSTVGGTCPAGTWNENVYQTGFVTADCTVVFSGAINRYTVSPTADAHTVVNASAATLVDYGTTKAFTVTPSAGYTVSTTVGGTCPSGSWSGSVYTTGAITADCGVSFSSTINS